MSFLKKTSKQAQKQEMAKLQAAAAPSGTAAFKAAHHRSVDSAKKKCRLVHKNKANQRTIPATTVTNVDLDNEYGLVDYSATSQAAGVTSTKFGRGTEKRHSAKHRLASVVDLAMAKMMGKDCQDSVEVRDELLTEEAAKPRQPFQNAKNSSASCDEMKLKASDRAISASIKHAKNATMTVPVSEAYSRLASQQV